MKKHEINKNNDEFVVMPVFCSLCKKDARDILGNYYVRKDGKGVICPKCFDSLKKVSQ